MVKIIFAFTAIIILGAGCLQTTQTTGTEQRAEENELTQTEEETDLTLAALEATTVAESDLDVDDGFELSSHTTYFAVSDDGIEWTLREEPIARYASVPDLVSLDQPLGPFPKKTLLVYFVDGTQDHGNEDLELGLVWSLDDGETWSNRAYTKMIGASSGTIVVDPSLVKLDDGRLRLYFFDFNSNPSRNTSKKAPRIHSAVSSDGITFEYEGIVFEETGRGITDPDVVQWNGQWLMYTMSHERGGMQVAMSDDPLSFKETETVNDKGIPGLLPMNDEIWLFSCGSQGITRSTSPDGIDFTLKDEQAVYVNPGVHCDASVEKTENGYAMVLKHIRAEDVRMIPRP